MTAPFHPDGQPRIRPVALQYWIQAALEEGALPPVYGQRIRQEVDADTLRLATEECTPDALMDPETLVPVRGGDGALLFTVTAGSLYDLATHCELEVFVNVDGSVETARLYFAPEGSEGAQYVEALKRLAEGEGGGGGGAS
jgi:hypothetical protein